MKKQAQVLIAELIEQTRLNINTSEELKNLSDQDLNYKESPVQWSVLECFAHLNIYGNYYNPEIKRSISGASKPASDVFNSGIIGNYFVNLITPKENLNKMNTLKENNPCGSVLNREEIEVFIAQQLTFLELLNQAKDVSLTKTKTGISISKWIKLRLGDTLRFVTAHNERHLIQARNVIKQRDASGV